MTQDGPAQEFDYIKRCNERNIGKILQLDMQSIRIRHELEQKRRGFTMMTRLAETLAHGQGNESIFIAASKRINATLNMQRTVVLLPGKHGTFRAAIASGYSPEEEKTLAAQSMAPDPALLDPEQSVIINGTSPEEHMASLRVALRLPYLVAAPIILNNEAAAILVTGRTVEQPPFMTKLGPGDLETVKTVSAFLAALLAGRRVTEAEERIKIMLDAMPACCVLFDENFRPVDCNAATLLMFAFTDKQEFLNRFHELSPEYQANGRISAEIFIERMQKALAEGQARFDWMHRTLDGEHIPSNIVVVRAKRGDNYILAAYIQDLRERRAMHAEIVQAQMELHVAREKAEKNAQAKSEFLANMSHEFRTPLNAVMGMAHLLNADDLTGKQREYVKNVINSAELLLKIFDGMMDYSAIDAGKLVLDKTVFSPRALIRKIVESTKQQARQKALQLKIQTDPDLPDALLGDPGRLEQILAHLAGNAIKFTDRGSVSIQAKHSTAPSGTVRLDFTVADTGVGMPEELVGKLFTPFTQGDASLTRKHGGTGLGLSVSHRLVSMMGGELHCASVPGKGSSFFFHVFLEQPQARGLEQSPQTAPGAGQAESGTRSLAGMRVLLVEDNDINQMIALELLESEGVAADVAANGIEALEALKSGVYDLALMDIQMPQMDGLTATEKIRSMPEYADFPVIAMTAHASPADREASFKAGMNDHITKPIDPQLLYATLRKWDRRAAF